MSVTRIGPFVDPLYGEITLTGIIADLLFQPELQRLRDVRLSNINSTTLPGCAGVSRFEHSVGTAHLASHAAMRMRLPRRDATLLTVAALLHDVGITPFGHLMEEAFRYAGRPFDHERRLGEIFTGSAEMGGVHYQIFRGRPIGTRSVLSRREWADLEIQMGDVFHLIRGDPSTPLGPLISGTVDLDNIDNVCRMAYHIGIRFSTKLPLLVAEGFFLEEGELCFDVERVNALEEWLDLRRRLYSILMTNPGDFAAKAMLIEAIRRAIVGGDGVAPALGDGAWRMTDTELQNRLGEYEPAKELIDRLARGDLYSLLGPFWVRPPASIPNLFSPDRADEHRLAIANALDVDIRNTLIYVIKDKRERRVDNLCVGPRGNARRAVSREFGRSSPLVLFGVALDREPAQGRGEAEAQVASYLERVSGGSIRSCRVDSYREEIEGPDHVGQLPLL